MPYGIYRMMISSRDPHAMRADPGHAGCLRAGSRGFLTSGIGLAVAAACAAVIGGIYVTGTGR